jgi:hypothetical protein
VIVKVPDPLEILAPLVDPVASWKVPALFEAIALVTLVLKIARGEVLVSP